ncbi:MAG: S8 family serine peptidase [Bacteroidota bacterium]
MKVRFLKDTNIRLSPTDLDLDPIGSIFKGVEIEIEPEPVFGMAIEGNAVWYKDQKGWFYWSGGMDILEEGAASAVNLSDVNPINTPITSAIQRLISSQEETPWAADQLELATHFGEEGITGKGVKIALLDTGIDHEHPDLEGLVTAFKDFSVSNVQSDMDLDGNGTHCAGIIVGQGKSSVRGIAPEAELMVGKIMAHRNMIDFDSLLAGIKWAYQMDADIVFTTASINERHLNPSQLSALDQLLETFTGLGVIFVAPVGDSFSAELENNLPASSPLCLSVGAYNSRYERFFTSAKSDFLDVLAPGEFLLTAGIIDDHDYFSGTAAAASVVCGTLALIKQMVKEKGIALSTEQLLGMVKETAREKPETLKCQDVEYGCGFFDAKAIFSRLKEAAQKK